MFYHGFTKYITPTTATLHYFTKKFNFSYKWIFPPTAFKHILENEIGIGILVIYVK